jgi:hypothetical protein
MRCWPTCWISSEEGSDHYHPLILASGQGWYGEGSERPTRRKMEIICYPYGRAGLILKCQFFSGVVIAVHKSSAIAEAERRLEEVYVRWADSPEAREFLSAAQAAFFASSKGMQVREAAVKATLLQLEPVYRSEYPFVLKSKEERQQLYLEWALKQPQWSDLFHRELLRFRAYRDAESKARQSLLEVFERRPEVQPLIADLLAAQREDRQRTESAVRARKAELLVSAAPSVPPSLQAEKRAAKRARKQELNKRRAEEAKARDEHRLNWLAQHGRKSIWA